MSNLVPPGMVESVDRRTQALALRRQGLTYERIGQRMRITKQAAHELVMNAIEDRRTILAEQVDAVRELELERLDASVRRLMQRLDDPKNANPERTVTALVMLSERRAKLLGLDAAPGASSGSAPPPSTPWDLTRLTDQQLLVLERLAEIATGKRPALLGPAGVAQSIR